MTTYEYLTTIIQIISTVATVIACIGIYYARRSFALAQSDHRRKIILETKKYISDTLNTLEEFSLPLRSFPQDFTGEAIFNDLPYRQAATKYLNKLEQVYDDIRDGVYVEETISGALKPYLLIVEFNLTDFMQFRRAKSANVHFWEGVDYLLQSIQPKEY